MGAGVFTTSSYACYNTSLGRSMDTKTLRVEGQEYTARRLDESLDPSKFTIRECVNSEEHPNTIPIILALDVTGSMGSACKETAAALGTIITNLYKSYDDIEFCVMGIGDLAYDSAPIQMSQFESDVRIAEALDKIYMEHGGGGNTFESYTAAWYMGLHKTKLDCYDKQGRKGIIITMGDEPLNPYLPVHELNRSTNSTEQDNIETNLLFTEASKKFDIYHIAVDDSHDSYWRYKDDIKKSFGQLLGARLKVSTINNLANVIEECIKDSVGEKVILSDTATNENGEITW